ncbi:hypothetical protein [Crenothrix sp.]|uniref:hypothetical protein n=1 Tax=Crenothrix sp. TaxID=3100433 RepID=UPI00374D3778
MNAKAIYFHHYGQRFDGETQVFNNFTLNEDDPSFNEQNEKIFKISDEFLGSPYKSMQVLICRDF